VGGGRHRVEWDRTALAPDALSSAPTISAADPNRSAGDFLRHRATTSATPLDRSGQRSASGRASLSSTRATTASGDAPSNGWAPHAYSYISTPKANTSARASTVVPLICSGAM